MNLAQRPLKLQLKINYQAKLVSFHWINFAKYNQQN